MQLLQKRVGKWNQIVVATLSRDSGLFLAKIYTHYCGRKPSENYLQKGKSAHFW